jgi:hypothetical protein
VKRTLLAASLMLSVSLSYAGTGTAQGSAFTYQGQLSASGSPANGNYDMTFALFDAATNGNQVGATILASQYPVAAGLFAIDLNFHGAFTGQQLWTEVTINGQTLAPRQPVNAVPIANFALTGNMGPIGPEGPTGATGFVGATGPTGNVGATGATGNDGVTGATGVPGAGATGLAGPPGGSPFRFDLITNLDDSVTGMSLVPPTLGPGSTFTVLILNDTQTMITFVPLGLSGQAVIYVYDSRDWYVLGPYLQQGPTGPIGPTGPTGPTGPAS